MSMKQNIEIDGKHVPFRASAAIPRIYLLFILEGSLLKKRWERLG